MEMIGKDELVRYLESISLCPGVLKKSNAEEPHFTKPLLTRSLDWFYCPHSTPEEDSVHL